MCPSNERLEISLLKRLGRTPKIWRDRKLRGNEVFNDEIKETLAETAIFVAVMSPRYLESTSCRAEVGGTGFAISYNRSKERFRCPDALVIKNYQSFNTEPLALFLAQLQQSNRASL